MALALHITFPQNAPRFPLLTKELHYHLKKNIKRMHILGPNRKPKDRQWSPSCSLFFLFTDAHKIESSQSLSIKVWVETPRL